MWVDVHTQRTTHQRPGNTMQHRVILISIETWKVQTWFVFVCVWRKTLSPFLPRNKFVKRSGPPSFSFRLWSPLAVFPTENPIQPGVIQILRGVQQNKVAYPVPNKCSRGYIYIYKYILLFIKDFSHRDVLETHGFLWALLQNPQAESLRTDHNRTKTFQGVEPKGIYKQDSRPKLQD